MVQSISSGIPKDSIGASFQPSGPAWHTAGESNNPKFGANPTHNSPLSVGQKISNHALELALGVLLGGGAGLLFHNRFPDFVKGGIVKAMLAGGASGALLMISGLGEWVINTIKLPYTIWYGLRHKHNLNPAHKSNPFLPQSMMDMQNEDIFDYRGGGKNPMLADSGFLSKDLFDQTAMTISHRVL